MIIYANAFSFSGDSRSVDYFYDLGTEGGQSLFQFSRIFANPPVEVKEQTAIWADGKTLIEDPLIKALTKQAQFYSVGNSLIESVIASSEIFLGLSFTLGTFSYLSGDKAFAGYYSLISGGNVFLQKGGGEAKLSDIATYSNWHASQVSAILTP